MSENSNDEQLASIEAMCQMIEDREWAEHVGKGPIGKRVESIITTMHNELQDAQKAAARQPATAAVPDGWIVQRDSTGSIYIGVSSRRLPGVWIYQSGRQDERTLWSFFDEMLTAAPSAPSAAEHPDTVPVPRDLLERTAEVVSWMACRSDVSSKDMRRLEESSAKLRAILEKGNGR